MRARLALVPGLSDPYQERISRTRVGAPRTGVAVFDSATTVDGFMRGIIGRGATAGKRRAASHIGPRRARGGARSGPPRPGAPRGGRGAAPLRGRRPGKPGPGAAGGV